MRKGILSAIALTVLGVTAFGEIASAQTSVRLWTFLDPKKTTGRDLALKKMIENFENANPGIKIVVESQVFSELGAKFLLGHRTNTAPDITFVNTENLGPVLKANATADLQSLFVSKWAPGDDADFYMRAAWDAAKIGNQRFAVPLAPATASIFYRKDLFAAAGIDPDTLKTWDQFNEAAKKLTKDTNGDGRPDIWGFGAPISQERTAGTTATVSMITAGQQSAWDGASCKPNYATPIGEKMVQMHADWINTSKVMPKEALVNNTDDILEQFAAGKFAMVLAPSSRFDSAYATATWGKENLAILPWPNWTADKSGPQIVTGWFLAVWNKSKNVEAAAKFVEYMISKEGVNIWATVGGQVPTRNSVFSDDMFKKPEYSYMRALASGWAAWSFLLPFNCNTARFDADLNTAVARVTLGEMKPIDALKEAEKKFLERQ